MAASRRNSKKRSAAKSAPPPDAGPTYFIDECLGGHFVADALRSAGAHVEVHHDHFPAGTPDAEWLTVVGQRGWLVLTKDRHIRRRELEVRAIVNARVRAFVLTARTLTGPQQAEAFVRALKKMNRVATGSRGPLIGGVSASGSISLLPLSRRSQRT